MLCYDYAKAHYAQCELQSIAMHITDTEFKNFSDFIYNAAGISMAPNKKTMISSRLTSRVFKYDLGSFSEYYALITSGKVPSELQCAVDLLTTNETYFFREMKHFDFLRRVLLQHKRSNVRVWSAACSTGEEPYSLAMVLADALGLLPWEIFATDINHKVIKRASRGVYSDRVIEKIPKNYLYNYCLNGIRSREGLVLIDKKLRSRIRFEQMNLNGGWPYYEPFDVIFLRNILIYFSEQTRKILVRRIVQQLRPGGYLMIGHSETITGISLDLECLQPSIYMKIKQ